MQRLLPMLFVIALVWLGTTEAKAQFSPSVQKPFANYEQPAAVSPWLNLFRNDSSVGTNYLTLVKPQLRQQNFNTQQQRTNQAQRAAALNQQRQLQNLSLQFRQQAQPQLGPTGSLQSIPANARFMNFSHYFGSQ